MVPVQTFTVGPEHGTLLLRTGVEGRAARMGHALTIALTAWECRTDVDGDTPLSVELLAQLPSLVVLGGEGGVKPLSDKDKRSIRDNALDTLRANLHPQVAFRSTAVQPSGSGWSLFGDFTLHGVTAPLAIDVTVAESVAGRRILGSTSVLQSDHGVSPYSGMLGGLQVSDRVEILVEVVVPQR